MTLPSSAATAGERTLADIRREVRECGEDGCTLEPCNDIRQLLGLMDELAAALKSACLAHAVHGDQVPPSWLAALARVRGTEPELP